MLQFRPTPRTTPIHNYGIIPRQWMSGRPRSAAKRVAKSLAQLTDLMAAYQQHYQHRKHDNFGSAHALIIRPCDYESSL
jgi:hypothetical protein